MRGLHRSPGTQSSDSQADSKVDSKASLMACTAASSHQIQASER